MQKYSVPGLDSKLEKDLDGLAKKLNNKDNWLDFRKAKNTYYSYYSSRSKCNICKQLWWSKITAKAAIAHAKKHEILLKPTYHGYVNKIGCACGKKMTLVSWFGHVGLELRHAYVHRGPSTSLSYQTKFNTWDEYDSFSCMYKKRKATTKRFSVGAKKGSWIDVNWPTKRIKSKVHTFKYVTKDEYNKKVKKFLLDRGFLAGLTGYLSLQIFMQQVAAVRQYEIDRYKEVIGKFSDTLKKIAKAHSEHQEWYKNGCRMIATFLSVVGSKDDLMYRTIDIGRFQKLELD